jgi:beta-N-acetylhexosaminidase
LLDGVMPAHVIYNQVCAEPAGFSSRWLKQILKKDLGFSGAVFSDDLSMHGASVAGGYVERADAALSAGCDMVLACNNAKGAEQILDGLEGRIAQQSQEDSQKRERVMKLHGRVLPAGLREQYESAVALIEKLLHV